MAKSSFFEILNGYESPEGSEIHGKRFAARHITGSVGHASTQGRFMRRFSLFCTKTANLLTYTAARTYGMFLLGFGLLTLLLHFAKDYLDFYTVIPTHVLVIGMTFALLSIPFLSTDEPLSYAIQDFALTDFIFFEFFCFQPAHRRRTVEASIPGWVGLILGLVCAVVGALVPIWYVLGVLLSLTYLYLSFMSPEFSLFATFLAMPYLPLVDSFSDYVLSALVCVTLVSFVRKVASGKRVWFFEKYDLTLAVMLFFVLISGVFVKGISSFTSSLVVIALSTGYVLTGSLVTNRRLADSVIKTVIVSSVPVSIYAIVQYAIAFFGDTLGSFRGSSSTFDSPDVLAIFLLVSAVFSTYFVFARRHVGTKVLYGVILVITLIAILSTLRVWALVAALSGFIAYNALRMKRGAGIVLGVVALLPYVMLLLPSAWLLYLSELPIISGSEIGDAIGVWIVSREMILDHILVGVGMGAESFVSEYFNFSGGSVSDDSRNFLLQILCEAGIFALLAFVSIFLIRLRHRAIYVPYTDNSQVTLVSRFAEVVVVVLTVYGLFTSLWSDMTMYYLFWCVFGLGSAVLRVSKREFDERVAYFSDGSGASSASIDISIK